MVDSCFRRYRQIPQILTIHALMGCMNNQDRMPRERRELDPEDVDYDFFLFVS